MSQHGVIPENRVFSHCVHCAKIMHNYGTYTMGVNNNEYERHFLIEPCECQSNKCIADLEAKLAQLQTEIAEIRGVHRQMVNDAKELGDKLIDDTCG